MVATLFKISGEFEPIDSFHVCHFRKMNSTQNCTILYYVIAVVMRLPVVIAYESTQISMQFLCELLKLHYGQKRHCQVTSINIALVSSVPSLTLIPSVVL